MKRKINRIKLYVEKRHKLDYTLSLIKEELEKKNFTITNKNYDLVISIGGDGTFLGMVKNENFNTNIYYIGINSGTLGFLQEIDINNTKNFVERLFNNDFKEEEIYIQKTTVKTKKMQFVYYSLNEVVLRKDNFKVLKAPIYIDNELLENFTGDGLLISTPTGSTAYNMSFGGPIIYNTLKTLLITPIAPLNNKIYQTLVNPIIVPDDKIINIKFNNENVFLMVDGTNIIHQDVLEIESEIVKESIKCIRMNDFHYIRRVNSKFLKK